MILRVSWAIVVLVVTFAGIPAIHQVGSFASLASCQNAVINAEKDMELEQWPDGFVIPPARWALPNRGATLTANAPGACEVLGANIASAEFFMDGQPLPQGTLPGRYTCNLDTTKFPDGRHTLAAVVRFQDGTFEKLAQKLFIKNGTAPLAEMPKAAVVHMGCVQKT